jgi:hypothetical protein
MQHQQKKHGPNFPNCNIVGNFNLLFSLEKRTSPTKLSSTNFPPWARWPSHGAGTYFKTFSLGQKTPRLGPIQVCQREEMGVNIEMKDFILL